MHTYHIHIEGLVQGVGFRPYIYTLANKIGLQGTVTNGPDGVHIVCTGSEESIFELLNTAVKEPPLNALIRHYTCQEETLRSFSGFTIATSEKGIKPNLLLTPDLAICPHCRNELQDDANRRYHYPFITCLQCGPRFSIMKGLPYDRELTTMAPLVICPTCKKEYENVNDRRHYSQTNSCPDCAIPLKLLNQQGELIDTNPASIFELLNKELNKGHIVAVKGIGGYLLLCDATKRIPILQLRDRKHRPAKPLAVLYPNVVMAEQDLIISAKEKLALMSKEAPIVLCSIRDEMASDLCAELLAPGLSTIGIMLPYTGVLELIVSRFAKPLVATSGNLSGSPIIFTDEDAICYLTDYADFVLAYEREIVMPQDDSVLRFTVASEQRIVIRRSRGMAPNYFPSPFDKDLSALAMGAELKSSFSIADSGNLYVSQFLGDQSNYESQQSYRHTLQHFITMLQVKPTQLLIDAHPGYQCSSLGKELAEAWGVPFQLIQHHKAHFGAVLAENKLLDYKERILGVIWDGTGFGDDGQIWGGEFFVYSQGAITREGHFQYFPQLVGDKMSKEPRLSALSLLQQDPGVFEILKDLFTTEESNYYQKLLQQPATLYTSSVGRLLDGVAAILRIRTLNTFEGEAAMMLESLAALEPSDSWDTYTVSFVQGIADWKILIREVLTDYKTAVPLSKIARKLFVSLVLLIERAAEELNCCQLAFSGGVFQNALLVDLIYLRLHEKYKLYFHQQLSPNDECIGFGQLAVHAMQSSINKYDQL